MKYLLFLIPVVLISLCSSLPDIPFLSQNPLTVTTDLGSPDIYVKAETLTPIIRGGRNFQVFFELRNKQTYDLTNINFEVYDHPCIEDSGKFKMTTGTGEDCRSTTLRSNETCMWSWRWTAKGSDIDKQCQIRFSVSYDAQNSFYQDIVVLSDAEYTQRELEGTLGEVPIRSTSPRGPLNVFLTFSEPQPFISSFPNYGMDINYYNIGNGIFDNIDIDLIPSSNMLSLSCEDYTGNQLTKDLKFIKGRSVPSECTFDAGSTSTIDIKTFNIDIDYTYKIYNSMPISIEAGGV